MITPAYAQTLARYNTWQNQNLYEAAARLSDEQRKQDRGAFFGSIHATLNHLLWADQMWLMRFGVLPAPVAKTIPEGLVQFGDWETLRGQRLRLDSIIQDWADGLVAGDLSGDLNWHPASIGRDMVTPRALAIAHFFNHQTHHRGQVHALITAGGVRPGSTDLAFMPGV